MRLLESKLSKHVRSWPEYDLGLITFIEPGKGSDIGITDCLMNIDRRLVPIELKRGSAVLTQLRPSQRAWHRDQLANGVQTFGLTLVDNGSVRLFRIVLTGGRSGNLIESFLKSWESMEDVSFGQLIDVIIPLLPRTL